MRNRIGAFLIFGEDERLFTEFRKDNGLALREVWSRFVVLWLWRGNCEWHTVATLVPGAGRRLHLSQRRWRNACGCHARMRQGCGMEDGSRSGVAAIRSETRPESEPVTAGPFQHHRPTTEVVGFKGERHKPSYRSVTPLDARRLRTFNWAADRDHL